jgi:hypothetical protein
VYQELNGGEYPTWTSHEQAREWAIRESDRLEPIVLSILRRERHNIQWTAGLAVARATPTPKVIAELRAMLSDMVRNLPPNPGAVDEMGLTNIIDILADQSDHHFVADVRTLLSREGESRAVVEHCVAALRLVGTRDDIETVRRMPVRRADKRIEHLARVTERIIEERASGRAPLADAPEQLRALTRAWIETIENRDHRGFVKLLPFGAEGGFDEHDFHEELLKSPELPKILDALAAVAGQEQFEVDAAALRASLVIDGRYKFDYVLEADGWKIGGPTQIAP